MLPLGGLKIGILFIGVMAAILEFDNQETVVEPLLIAAPGIAISDIGREVIDGPLRTMEASLIDEHEIGGVRLIFLDERKVISVRSDGRKKNAEQNQPAESLFSGKIFHANVLHNLRGYDLSLPDS